MSSQLLFTASSQKQFGDWGTGIENDPDTMAMGIEDPNNYKNDLRDTILVPANSEIAVVNCEINREMSFQLGLDNRFYWWYDELLTSLNQNEVGCLPFPISMDEVIGADEDGRPIADGLDLDNLPGDRYAELIQEAMRECICMPQFYRTATCTIDPSSAGRKLRFSITSHGNQKSTNTDFREPDYTKDPPIQSWVGLDNQNKDGFNWDVQWTAGTTTGLDGGTFKRIAATSVLTGYGPDGNWDDVARGIMRTAPISVVEGSMIVDFTLAPTGFEVGLSRPQTHATWSASDLITQYNIMDDSIIGQCDYLVKYWDKDNAGTKVISIFELIRGVPRTELDQDDPQGISEMMELTYYGTTTGGRPNKQIDEGDIISAGKKYIALKFEIKGEAMEITLGDKVDFSGTNQIIMTSFSTSGDPTQKLLPIGMNTWALYPLCSIPTINESVCFTQYSTDSPNALNWTTNTGDSYNYPLDKNDRCNTEAITGYSEMDDGGRPWIAGSSFYGWGVTQSDARYGDDWGPVGLVSWMYEFLKSRNYFFNGHDGVAATFPCRYKLLDTDSEAPDLVHGIITEKGDWGEQFFDTDGIYSTLPDYPPNMSRALGILYRNLFQTVDGVTSNIAGTKTTNDYRGKWVVIASDDFGDEPDIMLIEVLPFNHQSYNLCRNVPSKMVYVVPKSDYNGRVHGKMYHEAKDRYYISLNNPADIYINQLEVRFTDKNGITTRDLTGCSVVTFHIQPQRLAGRDFGGG